MIMPLLTVVVPIYNVEKYLRECLDSIVNQTYTNLEIIIVNDCSPDNSEEIILEYQKNDSRIKYIKHEKNLFQGGARNTGIQNATGEWITFVDSDDYIDLDTYECMMDLIQKNNVDMVIFSIDWFEDGTKKNLENTLFNIPTPTKISIFSVNPAPWNKIFRLSDIVDNNLTFPEHLKLEDLEFWFKYVVVVDPTIIGCPKKFHHYRQRGGSTMTQDSSFVDMGYVLQNIYKYLVEKNLFDKNQEEFFKLCTENCYFNNISDEINIKLLTIIHDFLQQFDDDMLLPYKELLHIKNSSKIDEKTIRELEALLPINTRIKLLIKKILKKLRLFEFAKSIRNKLSGR